MGERLGCLWHWGMNGSVDVFGVVCKVGDVEILVPLLWRMRLLCTDCMYRSVFLWIVPMVVDHENSSTLSELSVLFSQRSVYGVVIVWLAQICWRKEFYRG